MSEEAIADSEVVESVESEVIETGEVEEGGIDLEAAGQSIAEDLFGTKPEEEESEEEVDEIEEEVEEAEEEPEEEEEEKTAAERPQSWSKEAQEVWDGMSKEAQDQVLHREEQMRNGLEKDRTDANMGRTIRDVMTPYSQMFNELEAQGMSSSDFIGRMLNAHYQLSTSTPEGKQALFSQLAQQYGISLDGVKEAPAVDPAVQNLQNQVSSMQNILTQSQQATVKAQETRVSEEISAFAEEHEHFDEVADDIATFIRAGQTLEEAYASAVKNNPVLEQKRIDALVQSKLDEKEAQRKQDVAKAKKLKSTNVKGRNTNKTPTASLGSMEDTMRDTMRDIKSRH